ncbi:MAG: hypothetical protein ACOWWH_12915 [Eubacteriaceae bacterium]
MKKRIFEYIIIVFALITLRLLYICITRKPFTDGVFLSTVIGMLFARFIIDKLRAKKNN